MTISGFSFVRNGFDYKVPFMQSMQSILPLCDEFVMVVGDSSDGTREAIAALQDSRIRMVDTVWDMSLREGGRVFAQQSNIGLDAVTGDWAFHIQADEVIHEDGLALIKSALEAAKEGPLPEAFIFPYLHFWGDYQHIRNSRRVHNHEVRLLRNQGLIRSYRDSQGFRKYQTMEGYLQGTDPGEKLKVKKINTPIYHYNGVRNPLDMLRKQQEMWQHYGETSMPSEDLEKAELTLQEVDRTIAFKGTHPAVMQPLVTAYNYTFKHNPELAKWRAKDRLMQPLEDWLGFKIGEYRNYAIID